MLGVEPSGDAGKARSAIFVHWACGTSWGGFRGVLAGFGLRGPMGAAAQVGAVWGGELVMLPALEVAPPLKEWEPTELVSVGSAGGRCGGSPPLPQTDEDGEAPHGAKDHQRAA